MRSEKVIDHVLLHQAMKHLEERERQIIQYTDILMERHSRRSRRSFIFPGAGFKNGKKDFKKTKKTNGWKILKNMLK